MSVRSILAPALAAGNRLVRELLPVPQGAVRMLVLHDVPPDRDGALCRLLDRIAAGSGFVTPAQAAARLSGEVPDDGACPVLLTFDDGFISNGRVARDILAPRGIRGLFFVCPGLIDLPVHERHAAIARHVFRGKMTASALPRDLDLLGWEQLAGLAADGHEIGCHGLDHDCLGGLDEAALERQVATAKHRMATVLNGVPAWFAFPFGDIASIDGAALSVIGRHFSWCRSGIRGTAHAGSHPLALPAESVELSTSSAWIDLCGEGGLAPLYRRRLTALETMAVRVARS